MMAKSCVWGSHATNKPSAGYLNFIGDDYAKFGWTHSQLKQKVMGSTRNRRNPATLVPRVNRSLTEGEAMLCKCYVIGMSGESALANKQA